jgi:hypothetical protein
MTRALAATPYTRKSLRLALLGAASSLALAALSSAAQAQVHVTCNSGDQ